MVVGGGRVVPSRRRTGPKLRRLNRYRVLVIDEVGYLPFDTASAALFLQLVASSYATGSIVLTSNLSFSRWGETLGDDVVAAATIDRLVPHVIALDGDSYRTRAHRTGPAPAATVKTNSKTPTRTRRGSTFNRQQGGKVGPALTSHGAPGPGSPWGCGPGAFRSAMRAAAIQRFTLGTRRGPGAAGPPGCRQHACSGWTDNASSSRLRILLQALRDGLSRGAAATNAATIPNSADIGARSRGASGIGAPSASARSGITPALDPCSPQPGSSGVLRLAVITHTERCPGSSSPKPCRLRSLAHKEQRSCR